MKKYILQAAIGLLLGLCFIKQVAFNQGFIGDKNAASLMKYCSASQSFYKENDAFNKLMSQKRDKSLYTAELLTKSKREKVFVTEEK